ncbi:MULTISPECIES: helix-turn-helix domain-containing protein [Paenibacillus]|uniref:MerR family transcriptional regulator n=1 Tax=Paenibacillus vini TaxID=1476024 RepID=A0ABQ4MIX4_9BACL|nr:MULTISPECIES: helix-turn-helix domain-containing protein [Paenibacillus]MBQ4897601.1 MerR family transcriptional regulator [Paenibacillus sp. Marseille-P2973]MDN4070164.1 helix-turn-helix domain-containing protein [Paenibacillus vini]GIP55360.1 MerR family transcriptional regulator [Paenibacillus vini]
MSRQRSMEAILASEYVSIGELTRLTGARYSTLKFYTEEGMLPFEQAEENLTRRYPRESTVELILRIKQMKADGLSIPQIKDALKVKR